MEKVQGERNDDDDDDDDIMKTEKVQGEQSNIRENRIS